MSEPTSHVLGDFDVLDLVEILFLRANFVGVAQQRADQALVQGVIVGNSIRLVSAVESGDALG